MRVVVITTTIRLPLALQLFRAIGPDVAFFVAGDRKTPDDAAAFCSALGARYLSFDAQERVYPALSKLTGENCIQRRNFATLEALKSGADILVFWDDDNLPLNRNYFSDFERALSIPFHGLKVSSATKWFDIGQMLDPKASHRGFPPSKIAQPSFAPIVGANVGVAAGLCLGDPDISACTRIASGPIVHQHSVLLNAGVVVDPRETKTVWNSQNTAVIRELAPAMFMIPHIQRYDDIVASLICQRVMSEKGLHVHFGQPAIWQSRNEHNLVRDLEDELWGMAHVEEFAGYLDKNPLEGRSTLEWLRWLYDDLLHCAWWPEAASHAGFTWCDACEQAL